MNTSFKLLFTAVFLLFGSRLLAQTPRQVSLQECLDQAVMESPLYKQHQLQTASTNLQIKNQRSERLPQLSLNGKATWQNKVLELPISLPGVSIPSINKDQYQLSLGVSQAIYRGGILKEQEKISENALAIANMQTNTELYSVKSQAKTLFFQLLLTEKQKEIVASYYQTLQQKLSEVQSLVDEGVALSSAYDALKLEMLNSKQELFNIEATRRALLKNMNELTQLNLDEKTVFVLPEITDLPMQKQDRFEYHLLNLQQQQFEASKSLLSAQNRPMLFAFANAGYGRPGYNMLSNGFDQMYLLGVNLKWDLWNWNKTKKQKEIADINKQLIETKKQSFELNIQLGLNQLMAEIEKQKELLSQDPELIALHKNVVKTTEAQFKNGTITSIAYVLELQKLKQARLNYELHQISLVNSQLSYIELLGKL